MKVYVMSKNAPDQFNITMTTNFKTELFALLLDGYRIEGYTNDWAEAYNYCKEAAEKASGEGTA